MIGPSFDGLLVCLSVFSFTAPAPEPDLSASDAYASLHFIDDLGGDPDLSLVEMLHLVQANLGLDQPYSLSDFKADPTL